jgi:CheY-like chemotaxis protein
MEMAGETASPWGPPDLEPLTVLIVEDDDAVVEGTCDLLEAEGYYVVRARDGHDALDQLRRGLRPCVILLDLMMPRMNGWEFRQEQLRDDDLRDIPVVVITAGNFSEASLRAQLGDIEFVPKLSSPDTLLAAIRRRCGEPIP